MPGVIGIRGIFEIMLRPCSILAFLFFSFAFAEAQTGTIMVKKNDCNCMVHDTVAVPDTELTNSENGEELTIRGTVMDTATGKPLQKIAIYYSIDGKKGKTTTDQKGNFFIKAPSCTFSLSASKNCYKIKRSEFGPDSSTLYGCEIWMIRCEKNVTPLSPGNGN